ncbi:hypothetical protein KFZ76_15950 [Methylovulum psychrotolerans]|uniref:hypothetical protein n=1 Tax=Methylovulum psychrotolerans TaxID=1704499 RepID=UPI001BFFD5D1|nr:hypothetical protein [Methylovulum psychrotolerans]MBT9099187.1 hypothetical protein [Methylovulum psychrotolerans]
MSDEIFNLIKSLGEVKFNDLVKEYNKCKYDTWDVNIVNGPYDGGIDLVIRINDRDIKKCIQITVNETSFEKKLTEDLEKSQRNITDFGYMNEMLFFCPYRVTKSKQNKLERDAEISFGINLQIIDGWKISEDCSVFDKLKGFIYKLHDVDVKQGVYVSKEEKIVFDYLALSKESADLKNNFIHFYILSYLQDNPLSTIVIIQINAETKFFDICPKAPLIDPTAPKAFAPVRSIRYAFLCQHQNLPRRFQKLHRAGCP